MHTGLEEITFLLVKAIPLLSAQPFKAVDAVQTIDAPEEGCHIQSNDHEQDDKKCHHMSPLIL